MDQKYGGVETSDPNRAVGVNCREFFGPLWFYLLSIPYLIFNGDPRNAVLLPLVSNLAVMVIGWKILRKYSHPQAADFFAILYGVSPAVVGLSSFAFHANLLLLPHYYFSLVYFNYHQLMGLPLSALMASLSFHFEPAAGIMSTIFFGLALIFTLVKISWPEPRDCALRLRGRRPRDSKHTWGYSIIIAFPSFFTLPFLPQFIFELRHDFIQTKALTAYFQRKNPSNWVSWP